MIPVQPKIVWSIALLLLTAPAQARVSDYECVRGFGGRLERLHLLAAEARREHAAKVGQEQAAAAAARLQAEQGPGKIHDTLVGMRDAVGVGERVADHIERTTNISVEFDAIPGISSHDEIGGSVPLITLRINKDLPRTPRVLSIAIAKEAFELMYEQMADSAEKAYMQASMASRVWIELGGSKDGLPVIDGTYTNDEMAALLKSWVGKPSHQALREIGAARKLPSLQQLLSDNEMEIDRLQRFADEDREHEYRTHHPAPDIQPQVKRYYEAKQQNERLEKSLQMYVEFMTGVEYKDVQGNRRNDHKGEDAWRLMYQGRF